MTTKVLLAFVLPILVFIVSAGAFEQLLRRVVLSESGRTLLVFVLASAVCALVIGAVRIGRTRPKEPGVTG